MHIIYAEDITDWPIGTSQRDKAMCEKSYSNESIIFSKRLERITTKLKKKGVLGRFEKKARRSSEISA